MWAVPAIERLHGSVIDSKDCELTNNGFPQVKATERITGNESLGLFNCLGPGTSMAPWALMSPVDNFLCGYAADLKDVASYTGLIIT